jgi:hypothetical protein
MAQKGSKKRREEPEVVSGGKGEIVIYRGTKGTPALEVRLEEDTLWLTQKQIAVLFSTERSVITKHLRNVFRDGELERESVCAKFAHTAEDGKVYQTDFYNLDAILSVGYRVNSVRGTQFRIWATGVLRDHLVKGYSVNARRLKELRQSLKLVGQVLERYDVTSDQARGLLQVVTDYSSALDLLDDYDHQRVWRRRPPTCSIFSSRTTVSWTATNASPPPCSSGSWRRTASCTVLMVPNGLPTTPWWP